MHRVGERELVAEIIQLAEDVADGDVSHPIVPEAHFPLPLGAALAFVHGRRHVEVGKNLHLAAVFVEALHREVARALVETKRVRAFESLPTLALRLPPVQRALVRLVAHLGVEFPPRVRLGVHRRLRVRAFLLARLAERRGDGGVLFARLGEFAIRAGIMVVEGAVRDARLRAHEMMRKRGQIFGRGGEFRLLLRDLRAERRLVLGCGTTRGRGSWGGKT